jgi:hypothetical protein
MAAVAVVVMELLTALLVQVVQAVAGLALLQRLLLHLVLQTQAAVVAVVLL